MWSVNYPGFKNYPPLEKGDVSNPPPPPFEIFATAQTMNSHFFTSKYTNSHFFTSKNSSERLVTSKYTMHKKICMCTNYYAIHRTKNNSRAQNSIQLDGQNMMQLHKLLCNWANEKWCKRTKFYAMRCTKNYATGQKIVRRLNLGRGERLGVEKSATL